MWLIAPIHPATGGEFFNYYYGSGAPAFAAPRTIEAQANKDISNDDKGRVSTTSYTKGAYNANNAQINLLITDTAVTREKNRCIVKGDTVGSNLEALDDCIDEAVSGIANEIESTGTITVPTTTVALYDDWTNDKSTEGNDLTIVNPDVIPTITITNTVKEKPVEDNNNNDNNG